MKTLIAAGLLAFAGPAFAQSAPAHPAGHAAGQHQDHSQHHGQKQGEGHKGHEGHKAEAGKHCCCKDMKADAKMECCDKHKQHQSSSDAHKGHQPNH